MRHLINLNRAHNTVGRDANRFASSTIRRTWNKMQCDKLQCINKQNWPSGVVREFDIQDGVFDCVQSGHSTSNHLGG